MNSLCVTSIASPCVLGKSISVLPGYISRTLLKGEQVHVGGKDPQHKMGNVAVTCYQVQDSAL